MDLIQSSLENKIKRYQRAYYKGEPLVSDEEFDRLWDKLKEDYPDSALLKKVGSDLQKTASKKGRHYMLMGSQEKFNTIDGLRKWLKDEEIQFPVMVQPKLDGVSIEIQYTRGEVSAILTRGDGYIGESVPNLVRVNGVPRNGVAYEDGTLFTGSVRGELVISRTLFERRYKGDFKNPRNFVAGAMKNEKFQCYSDLVIVSYDVYSSQNNYWVCAREDRKAQFLENNGFAPAASWSCINDTNIINLWNRLNPKSLEYDIDGLVIKQNQVDFNDYKELRPKKQHAFKWPDQGQETTLVDVEWSRSGTTFTPVAILDPVDIEGSTVSRASLANPSLIRDLNLKIGDTVLVTKRGMIIPKIEKVTERAKEGKTVEIPKVCPVCGEKLKVGAKSVTCINPLCPGNHEHQISKWLNTLDVKGFGSVMKSDLSFWSITSIPSLYYPSLVNRMIEEYGSINCRKAFDDLYAKSKNITLAQFIAGFDIEGIGIELINEVIRAGYNTFDKIDSLGIEELSKVNNWSEKRAGVFRTGWLQNRADMKIMLDGGIITLVQNTPPETTKGALKGLHICVTGKLEHFTRKQIEEFLKENGAIADGGVTSKTDLLVTNDRSSGSSKLKNAEKYGTRIISEQELVELVSKG